MYGDHSPRRDGRVRHFITARHTRSRRPISRRGGTASTLFEAIALVLKAIGTDKVEDTR
jgi:hypothetical protein